MNFTTFLNKLNAQEENLDVKFDPQKEIEEYKDYLKQLYNIFKQALHIYVNKRKLIIIEEKIQINEESLGSYEATQLFLKLNTVHIQLKPEGTMLIGAKGRVRMIGPKGAAKIILMRKDFPVQQKTHSNIKKNNNASEDSWVWRFVGSDNISFTDVTKDSIQKVIMELVNG